MFALSSISEASPDILADKLGIIGQYLLLRHSGGEPAENVVYGDRRPRTQGFQPRFPGSTVILSKSSIVISERYVLRAVYVAGREVSRISDNSG
jgi:hypothetical protein